MEEKAKNFDPVEDNSNTAKDEKANKVVVGEVVNEERERLKVAKEVFLEMFERSNGRIKLSCKIANISRNAYYDWRDKSKSVYDEAFDKACAEIISKRPDHVEELLLANAEEGNVAAQIFYLKSKHPEYIPKSITAVAVEGKTFEDVIKALKDENNERTTQKDNRADVSDQGQTQERSPVPVEPRPEPLAQTP